MEKKEEITEEVKISKENFNKTLKQYESDVLSNRSFQISFDMKNKDKIKLIDLINEKKAIIANKSTYVIYPNKNKILECKTCHKRFNKEKNGFGHSNYCRYVHKPEKAKIRFIKENIKDDNENEDDISNGYEFEEDISNENEIYETLFEKNKNNKNYKLTDFENKSGITKITRIPDHDETFKCYNKKNCIYIKKITNIKEYTILNDMKNCEHFPEIKNCIFNNKDTRTIYIPYYEHDKFSYNQNLSFIKSYIKSLLTCIKELHSKNYVHGDIKPGNFIYNNEKNYHLIDFDYSSIIGEDFRSRGTFPFSAPEKEKKISCYCKRNCMESDIWSVGIILLLLLSKRNIFKYMEKYNEFKYINQYSVIYGKTQLKNQTLNVECMYDKNLIENNIKIKNYRVKQAAIDLIKKLIKFEKSERISVAEALDHEFLTGEKSNDLKEDSKEKLLGKKRNYYNLDFALFEQKMILNQNEENYLTFCSLLCKQKSFQSLNKYEQMQSLKICIICNTTDQSNLEYCQKCGTAYHEKCKKQNKCLCETKEKNDINYVKNLKIQIAINKMILPYGKGEKLNLVLPLISNELPDFDKYFKKKNLEFYDDLLYGDEIINYCLLESGIMELNDDDKEIYYKLKQYTRKGLYNFIKIKKDNIQGCVVRAKCDIKKKHFIVRICRRCFVFS